MIRFFKNLQPAALFAIPFLALILWSPGFFKPVFFAPENHEALAGNFLNWVDAMPRVLQVLFSIVLLSFSAIYLNVIMNKHEVLYKNTYLPAVLYVLLMSFHPDMISFHPALVSNLLLIVCLNRTFSLFKNESPVSPIVDTFLLLSVASFFYFPVILLFFLFLYALKVLRSFHVREWLIALILFLLPYFFLSVYAFWTDSLPQVLNSIGSHFRLHDFSFPVTRRMVLFVSSGYLVLLVALAVIRLRIHFYKNSIKTRSTQQILVAFSAFSVLCVLLENEIRLFQFTQLAIPFSVFLGYWYVSAARRMWMYEMSIWILIAGIAMSYL